MNNGALWSSGWCSGWTRNWRSVSKSCVVPSIGFSRALKAESEATGYSLRPGIGNGAALGLGSVSIRVSRSDLQRANCPSRLQDRAYLTRADEILGGVQCLRSANPVY